MIIKFTAIMKRQKESFMGCERSVMSTKLCVDTKASLSGECNCTITKTMNEVSPHKRRLKCDTISVRRG